MSKQLIGSLQVGSTFGESAMLSDKGYEVTVKTNGPVSVLVISRDTLFHLCGKQAELPSEIAAMERMRIEADEDDEPGADAADKRRPGRRPSVFVEAVEVDDKWVPPSYPHTTEELARLREHVGNTVLLSHLDTHARDNVIGAFQRMEFPSGHEIIKQGADGDFYYILDSGHADVWKSSGGGPATKVNEYNRGGAFGELSLLHGEPRLASVRASEDSVCWALDRLTFRKIMMSTGRNHMNERINLIGKVPGFKDLTPFDKFKVAEAMKVRDYENDVTIVEEGAPGEELFIIQKGTCDCYSIKK